MNSRWNMVYPWTIESDNLRLIVYRLYEDIRDTMSDNLRPEWEGRDEYLVEVTKLNVEYELIELRDGGFMKYRHEDVDRSLRFQGDINFVDCIRMIAEKYDDFSKVSKIAEILKS